MALNKQKEGHERISLDVPQGKRAVYKAAAKQFKVSLVNLINLALDEFIENHSGEDVKDQLIQHERFTTRDKLLIEKYKQLSPKTQRAVMKFIDNVASLTAGDKKEGDSDGESDKQNE